MIDSRSNVGKELKQDLPNFIIDTLGAYVIGCPLPYSFATKLILKKVLPRWMYGDFYMDFQLKNWVQIYSRHLSEKPIRLVTISYKKETYYLPQIIEIDGTHKHLSKESIIIEKIPVQKGKEETFHLDPLIESINGDFRKTQLNYYKILKRTKIYNGLLLRLEDIARKDGKYHLKVGAVSYYSNLLTNLCLDLRPQKDRKSLREQIHSEGELKPLAESILANPLGVNILIVTPAKEVILIRRSRNVAVRPLELCSSVSGDFLDSDAPRQSSFTMKNLIETQEITRELGFGHKMINSDGMIFLGLTRELIRGGKPETFFIAPIDVTLKEIKDKVKEAESFFEQKAILDEQISDPWGDLDPNQYANFKREIEGIIDKHNKISLPLLCHLALWLKYREKVDLKKGA
jgi:hypothetical protein